MQPDATKAPLAVYVHWPFCLAKCPYCDFNSHVRDAVDHAAWRDALVSEIRYYAKRIGPRAVSSIFFGGGTPSLMHPETVAAVIDTIGREWGFTDNPEITLEANPTSSESGKFQAFRKAGVNRLSLGIQSLKPDALTFLGRKHSADEAKGAIAMARDLFPRYSFDLIYARPDQQTGEWERELREALTLAGDHLSLYQLTIEPATPFFYARERGELREIDEDEAAELFQLTQDILRDAGLPAYEISNHAKPGFESRHNLTYWRYGDYAGIGPGAHGRLTEGGHKISTIAARSPEKWLELVQANGHGIAEETPITPQESITEKLLMGLRLVEGVALPPALAESINWDKVAQFKEVGWMEYDADRLQVTDTGRLRLNALLAEIIRE